MEMETEKKVVRLPKLEDIMTSNLLPEQKAEAFKFWLNQNPPQSWLKKLPVGGGKEVDYLPTECVEHLLTTIMVSWRIEIKQVIYHLNVVNVVVRLIYVNPIDLQDHWQDGTAAFEMYHSEKTGGIDRSARTASQAAETFAFKDAADKIGNIFGRNLNRKVNFDYTVKTANIVNLASVEATEK